jgi:ubiquinone/menaquinone biosynthesis C-methylase UbiE
MRSESTSEDVPFDRDVAERGGYVYTTVERLSTGFAMERQTMAMVSATDFRGRRVVDIGCGDGAATVTLHDAAGTAEILGFDPASLAMPVARHRAGKRPLRFASASAYALPLPNDAVDIAHLRGVLHHMDEPHSAIKEAARVARTVAVLEPNGWNPVLKAIEKLSAYHRAHGERSFFAHTIDGWMKDAGLKIVHRSFSGLVPYFCPDGAARLLKRVEPMVERLPGVRQVACGTYVVVGQRS